MFSCVRSQSRGVVDRLFQCETPCDYRADGTKIGARLTISVWKNQRTRYSRNANNRRLYAKGVLWKAQCDESWDEMDTGSACPGESLVDIAEGARRCAHREEIAIICISFSTSIRTTYARTVLALRGQAPPDAGRIALPNNRVEFDARVVRVVPTRLPDRVAHLEVYGFDRTNQAEPGTGSARIHRGNQAGVRSSR